MPHSIYELHRDNEDLYATQTNRTVFAFLSAKTEQLSAAAAQSENHRNMFKEPNEDGSITPCKEIMKQIKSESAIVRSELHALRKQRRAIEQDLHDCLLLYPDIGTAYTQLMISKIMAARGQSDVKFKMAAVEYYGARREKRQNHEENYCQVLGWMPESIVKAVPIVPRSLSCSGLDRLFGVKDSLLSDPRNGLLLHAALCNGWNEGKIIIVPVIQGLGGETEWKLVLTNRKWLNTDIFGGLKWKHIDGQYLKFPNPNRPAKRFLYFRFFISWLQCQNEENLGWDEDVFCDGMLWAEPGRYMRRSMVNAIASHVLDHYIESLPSGIIDNNTFEEDGLNTISAEEEAELADELSLQIEDFCEEARKTDASDEADDEATDDEARYFEPGHPARYSIKLIRR